MTGKARGAGPAGRNGGAEPLCQGRVVVVTGAGRGIGRAHARELARQGAHVVVNDVGAALDGRGRDPAPAAEVAEEISASGGRAVADGHDVADWDGARQLVAAAVDAFGRLDAVVNNAGVRRDQMVVNMTEDDWDTVVRVQLRATCAVSHFAAAHWRDENRAGRPVDGRIVTTTAPAGLFGSSGQASYSAATAGVAAFSMVASRELARYGVTVNTVSPRAVRTRMTTRSGLPVAPVDLADDFDPLAPENVAPLVAWLVSTQARHVSGQVFEVAGSTITLLEGWRRGARAEGKGRWEAAQLASVVDELLTG